MRCPCGREVTVTFSGAQRPRYTAPSPPTVFGYTYAQLEALDAPEKARLAGIIRSGMDAFLGSLEEPWVTDLTIAALAVLEKNAQTGEQ